MSRSKRKTPISGNTTAETDKPFKRIEHRKERRAVRVALVGDGDPPHPKEFGNPYASQKDGKRWFGADECARHPGVLRK